MDRMSILTLFDQELRINPPAEQGTRVDTRDGLVREIRETVCIIYSAVRPAEIESVIDAEVHRAASEGYELEWKLYGHDADAAIAPRLAAHGFHPDEPETLLVYDLAHDGPSAPPIPEVNIRRVHDEEGLRDLIAIQTFVFGRDHTQMGEQMRQRLTDPSQGLYVAYSQNTPVAAGRLSLPLNRSFAGLWGGGTLPGFRRRGIYRALVAARAIAARTHGYRYLIVEARKTSRPTLERLGFVPLTSVVGWIFRPTPAPSR